MLRPAVILKRSLIFIHRWLGVALSILFTLWFCSGIVMMYWDFPEVSQRDRLERAPTLTQAGIKMTPEQAWATLGRDGSPGSVTLSSFDGRPVYRFGGEGGGGRRRGGGGGGRGRGGNQTMVYADDGSRPTDVNDALIDRVATAWTKQPLSSAKKESVTEVDQWTVGAQLRSLRPLYKYSFADGQQVYISGRDAQVMQYTTSQSRFWAYLGAIPHWFYFTPLRKNQPQWFQFVIWTSGIGTISALLGIIVAIWMFSPAKRYRHAGAPTSIPYRGWKRWHTIIGLGFGIITVTWAFSGLLSMGPFEFVERLAGNRPSQSAAANQGATGGQKGPGRRGRGGAVNLAGALRGDARFDLAAFATRSPADSIAALGSGFQPKEIEFTMFAGEPVYMATDAAGATQIIPVNGEPKSEFDSNRIMAIVREAAGSNLAELRLMDEYDAYYLDRTGQRPLPVVYLRLNDDNRTRYYIDVKTGQIAGTYDSSNWVNRWLYHGLHSLDFPWLYKHRPLWDIVVILLMLGGTAVCVTSLVLTWRVLKRKLSPLLPAITIFKGAPEEDLAETARP
jgi:hypothetical protein